jgi:hypothetical protein
LQEIGQRITNSTRSSARLVVPKISYFHPGLLGGLTLVAMVKSSHLRNCHDAPTFWLLHYSRLWSVLGKLNVFSNAGNRKSNFAGSGATIFDSTR